MNPASVRFPENLPNGWRARLAQEKSKPYFKELTQFLKKESSKGVPVFPKKSDILKALQLVDFDSVKIVILGQDPYHGPDQAIGLSFAVPASLKPKPPSLMNIFKEMESDLGVTLEKNSSELTGWAKQGVLLLNTVLTVRAHEALSHRGQGWEHFTDQIIKELSARAKPVIFILWGASAQAKKKMIDLQRHFIIESVHPSPLSAYRGFFGSRPFSKANSILVDQLNETPIDWTQTA